METWNNGNLENIEIQKNGYLEKWKFETMEI